MQGYLKSNCKKEIVAYLKRYCTIIIIHVLNKRNVELHSSIICIFKRRKFNVSEFDLLFIARILFEDWRNSLI